MPAVAKRRSKLLVIDATVVHAAGETEKVDSSATRNFLFAVLEICHRAVLTTQIRQEWSRHQSKVTRRWRVAMYARRKISELNVSADLALRSRLTRRRNLDASNAILKDAHLIEAAREADEIVVSMDERARALFNVQELKSILWVNPISEPQRALDWLHDGAPPVQEWKLGYRA